MSIRSLIAAACGTLLSVSAVGARAQDTEAREANKTCCTAACAAHPSGKMRCSLTGKTMETCCCVRKDGKLYCTLADKEVDACCCQPVDETEADREGTSDETRQ